jgi:hypothetical protein
MLRDICRAARARARLLRDRLHLIVDRGRRQFLALRNRVGTCLRTPQLLAEHALQLEAAIRSAPRAAAEAAFRAAHPAVTSRGEGLSILIPCWNHAGLLPAAVDSALATLDVLPVPGES